MQGCGHVLRPLVIGKDHRQLLLITPAILRYLATSQVTTSDKRPTDKNVILEIAFLFRGLFHDKAFRPT